MKNQPQNRSWGFAMPCASLLTATALVAMLAPSVAQAVTAPDANSVLILSPSVSGGETSPEASAAAAQGFTVVLTDEADWSTMTLADFRTFRALIVGDPTCTSLGGYTATLASTTSVWGPATNGNVILIGTDPVFHLGQGGNLVTDRGIAFAAAEPGKTGLYLTLSCWYHGTAPMTPVPELDGLGTFTVGDAGGCFNDAHKVADHPALAGITDETLSNWSCSVHEVFDSQPAEFQVLAIARNFGSVFTAPDGSVGTPYILARGESLVTRGLSLTPTSATNPIRTSHTVTADLSDANDDPIVGALLRFSVTSGPNTGAAGACSPADCRTDALGEVEFTYTDTAGPGRDVIRAHADTDENTEEGPGEAVVNAIKDWEEIVTTTTLAPTTTTTLPVTGACCQAGDCFVATPGQCEGGSYQGDGTTCTVGICSDCGNGLVEAGEECDDANTTAGDGCDDTCAEEPCWACTEPVGSSTSTLPGDGLLIGGNGPSTCEPDDGQSCDDGDECTVNDGCSAGTCSGEGVLIPAACKWAVVGGDTGKDVRARTRGRAEVVGRVCADEIFIGELSETREIVGMRTSGNAIRISRAPVLTGDVATGGGAIAGKPNGTLLPGLAVDTVPTNAVQAKDMTSNYDTTGNHALVDECDDAQAGIDTAVPLLDALPSTANIGNVEIGGNGSLTLAPGSPAGVTAGGVNVIDIGRFKTGNNVTVTLDGGGNAATVYILRVNKKFDLHFKGDIVLTNGQTAGNVIIYGRNKCKFGEETTGGGTVICPEGKLFLEERATWNGALLGGKQRVEIRDSSLLTHVPLQIGN